MKKRILIEDDWSGMQDQVDFCVAELLLRSDLSHIHEWDHITNKPVFHAVAMSGSFDDLDDVPVMFSGDYNDLINIPLTFAPSPHSHSYNTLDDLPDLFSGDYNDLINKPTIPAAQIQSDWEQVNTGSLDFIKNKPVKTYNYPSRSINSAFQISADKDVYVSYTIPITTVAALLAGSRARVTLQYADNSGMSTNVVTVATCDAGVGSGLVVTGYDYLQVSGIIPAGKYVRLVTQNVLGTPTYGTVVAQEVTI